ncbi:lactonase family protein [Paenibacillus endoradicis]|uniref:lactonase family protein n=1 Tax=Paenibacillus endoradicis TaxID=2972487 RepID=UPI00215990A4|nr:lactonase family protein [Paenibacillus endoradicis]MCR8656779.1 lactonase family protein [Paenibacillus endoradicis]
MSKVNVYVGSYAETHESGVEVFTLNEQTGQLTKTDQYVGLKNPTFLNVDVAKKQLYAVSEIVNADGTKSGEISHFSLDTEAGTLSLVEKKATVTGTTCHVARDQQSKYLTVTSYHGGMIGLIALQEDGSLGNVLDVAQHSVTTVDPERQDNPIPHPHSSFYSPDGKYLYVQDLGLDGIVGYKVDQANGKLIKVNVTKLADGAGPRHLTFHPNATYAYVINELNSTVTAFKYEASTGTLSEIQTLSTLPPDFTGENGCAEITISADGRFVYGSNRGHDSIVVYEVDANDGTLTTIQHISTAGGHPRNFAITPSGEYLLVANRDGNNIVTFKRNFSNGLLENIGVEVHSSKPVCVVPVIV